jgi:hypothetical protein
LSPERETAATRAHAVWLETLRRLSPERKFRVLVEAWQFGFELRLAGMKLRFPDLSDDEARRRAVAEMVECHRKNSSRKSPLF